uniref:SH3 domain-binding protein 1 n=1 Tax=Zosterops lateralis melanops TaxID=1220523 RepID=A0A8D2P7R2_ZOSLA
MDKRVKKLPLMALSMAMAESFKELDTESSLGKVLEMGCCIQSSLAKIVAEFEIALEHYILQPLNKLSEEELPVILKRKKTLQKLISDWNTIKSRLNQAAKSSSNSTGAGAGPGASSAANKLEILKEEEEEVKRKVEKCKDEYMADLYHFSTKEDIYASYFIKLLEIQAQYHRQSLESLESALAELRESHRQTEPSFTTDIPVAGYYGVSLETHLKSLGREIALPIEACVMMLLASGMKEEGLFRLAAGASVLRKLKSSLASGSNALEEFYSDPHAVAGALKSYLRELPQPLMTFELYDEWVKVASLKDIDNRVQSLRDTCSRLPQDSYNNLRYLIKFLAKLAEHQEVNKMTPSNIAIVLGPNLLWSQQSTGDPMQLDLASVSSIQAVVEALIQNVDTLFPEGRTRASLGGPQQRVTGRRRERNISPSPGGEKWETALAPCCGVTALCGFLTGSPPFSSPRGRFQCLGHVHAAHKHWTLQGSPSGRANSYDSSSQHPFGWRGVSLIEARGSGCPSSPHVFLPPTPHQGHTVTGGCKVPRSQDHHAQPKPDLPHFLHSTSRDPEPRSQPASPAPPRPSPEAAGPPAPMTTDNTTRKG